jgi:hypothetical protein
VFGHGCGAYSCAEACVFFKEKDPWMLEYLGDFIKCYLHSRRLVMHGLKGNHVHIGKTFVHL